MFCPNCGNQMPDGVKFCSNCGKSVTDVAALQTNATPPQSGVNAAVQPKAPVQPKENAVATQPKKEKNGGKKKTWIPITATVAAIAVIGGGVGGYLYLNSPSKHYEAAMSKGNAALDEKQYKDAIKSYLEAKKIDDSKEDADEALFDAYLQYGKKLAKDENYEDAIEQYEKALKIKKKDKKAIKALNDAYFALACECLQNGKNSEALKYAKLILETDEEHLEASRLLLNLEGFGPTDPYDSSESSIASSESSEVYVPSSSEPEEVSPYKILRDASGNVYDLGGMEIIIRDWWSPWDPAEPRTEYEEQLQEYRDWIQETYNFRIKRIGISDWGNNPSDFVDYVKTKGDENNYVFILRPDQKTTSAMWSGLCYDLSTLDCLDFSKKKFTLNNLHKEYSLKSHVYAMSAGYSEPRTGVYFNKRMLKEVTGLSDDDLYDMQKNGTWTWDKFCEICDLINEDEYYYACNSNNGLLTEIAVYSNGGEFVGKDSNGNFVYKLEDQNTKEGLEFAKKIFDNYWEQEPYGAEWNRYLQSFKDGNYVFMIEQAYVGYTSLSDMWDDWGFVCFPKPDENASYVNYWEDNLAVIPACYDADRAWKIAFAWNLYTDPIPGCDYEDDESWKAEYYSNYYDRRAVEETLAMMRTNGVISYVDVIPGITIGPDLYLNVGPSAQGGLPISNIISGISSSWKGAIEEANQYLTWY